MTEEHFDNTPPPPTAKRVARRAIVMSVVVHRAFMESDADEPEVKSQCQQAYAWLKQLDVTNELESTEKIILDTPLG